MPCGVQSIYFPASNKLNDYCSRNSVKISMNFHGTGTRSTRTRCSLNCLFITVLAWCTGSPVSCFRHRAVGLLPGVIAAAVVIQETDYEHDICLLETVARCKDRMSTHGDLRRRLGRTRRTAGGETLPVSAYHTFSSTSIQYRTIWPHFGLWIMTARCQNSSARGDER